MIDLTDLHPTQTDGSHLTADQADHVNSYVARLLLALDLNHWRVHVGQGLPPEGCLLMIEPVDGRRVAMLYLAEDWWDRGDANEKRIDLTHEVLHLAHHDVDEHVRRFFDGSGDVADYPKLLFLGQFKTGLERMVDSLSYVIGPLMPEWVDLVHPDVPPTPVGDQQ